MGDPHAGEGLRFNQRAMESHSRALSGGVHSGECV